MLLDKAARKRFHNLLKFQLGAAVQKFLGISSKISNIRYFVGRSTFGGGLENCWEKMTERKLLNIFLQFFSSIYLIDKELKKKLNIMFGK